MNFAVLLRAWLLLLPLTAASGAALPGGFYLPKGRDAYFIENDLVYRRFLELMRDGAYRQINQDRTSCIEADQGTWEQTSDGTVRLHSTHHALRFRALLGGPLTVVLDSQAKIDGLTRLASAIRQFLGSSEDSVFGAHTVGEFSSAPNSVAVEHGAETYRRDDLQALARQIDHAIADERTASYTLTPLKVSGVPALLILQDAVFQAGDLPRVRREYHVPPNGAPPFYFAQVDARVFAREVGTWQAFRYLGGTE